MKLRSTRMLRQLAVCQEGSIAVAAGLVLTALVVGGGIAVDYGSMISKRGTLQAVADAASIAAAREMTLANVGQAELEAVAENMVSLKSEAATGNYSVSVSVDQSASSVYVSVSENWQPYFAHLLSDAVTPITASATAQVVGSGKICVLALDATSEDAILLSKKADLEAKDCGVYSNSVSTSGITSTGTSLLAAKLTCSAGGVSGTGSNFSPYPTTDCPPIPDPLIDRQPPVVGACDFNNYYSEEWNETLQPGVYCGGIEIGQGTVATFESGIYVVKDGIFTVGSNATAKGDNVAFHLVGDNATFEFTSKATIEFTAPKEGDLAGILFFEDRSAPPLREHKIFSENARILLGTFYLPQGRLVVKTAKPVADQSAYTAIVAKQLALDLNPTLVLNSDYSATDIPVPGALSGVGGRIVLAK